jgi:hypothetical protein
LRDVTTKNEAVSLIGDEALLFEKTEIENVFGKRMLVFALGLVEVWISAHSRGIASYFDDIGGVFLRIG